MTAAALTHTYPSQPTLAVAAGRTLALAGAVFGAANLFQFAVQAGLLDLSPAVLAISWPVAVGVFLIALASLRRSGGEAARRAAAWSRSAILTVLAVAGGLLALSFAQQDFGIMRWMSAATLILYALVWIVVGVRTGQLNMAVLAVVALGGAAAVAARLGLPDQYLIQAATLALVALLPGLWLAFGRRL
jgi:hypothetical protein